MFDSIQNEIEKIIFKSNYLSTRVFLRNKLEMNYVNFPAVISLLNCLLRNELCQLSCSDEPFELFTGTRQNSVDSLAFETLIPKSIVQRYVSLLLEHRRIILCGPSGTGKTYLAQKLAEHLVLR